MSVSDGEQGRACACAVRRHFGLILKTEPFFREKRLTFCEEKSRNFWSVERQKRAERHKCLADL